MKSYLTVTDQFCGAGGSSIGAIAAGAEIRQAMNHWTRALETYSTNHPETDVDCTDVSACDPRRYPATAPACNCLACRRLRAEGVDTRSYGSNEHNMGRAAHNLNQLMRVIGG